MSRINYDIGNLIISVRL